MVHVWFAFGSGLVLQVRFGSALGSQPGPAHRPRVRRRGSFTVFLLGDGSSTANKEIRAQRCLELYHDAWVDALQSEKPFLTDGKTFGKTFQKGGKLGSGIFGTVYWTRQHHALPFQRRRNTRRVENRTAGLGPMCRKCIGHSLDIRTLLHSRRFSTVAPPSGGRPDLGASWSCV